MYDIIMHRIKEWPLTLDDHDSDSIITQQATTHAALHHGMVRHDTIGYALVQYRTLELVIGVHVTTFK